MVRNAYVIDLQRCLGCRACVEACKVENNTSRGMFWMYVFRFEEGEYPDARVRFMPLPCQHCDNPPCVKVCPVGARHKRVDGLVLTDFERCIGCRYCQIACPYGVNYFNWRPPAKNQYFDWNGGEGDNLYGYGTVRDYIGNAVPPYKNPDHEKRYASPQEPGSNPRLVSGSGHYGGVMEKCTWCVHRLEKGLEPACVANCPGHVLHFGDLDDPNSEVSNLLRKKKHFRFLEELGTEPRTYYLGDPPPGHHVRPIDVGMNLR